jgi:hypothetical protein
MNTCETTADSKDPVRNVRILPSDTSPLSLTVTIELAEHVAACCVNADNAFVEFQGKAGHARSAFEFRESRPGHLFVATLSVPAPGAYSYRIVANVLGRLLNREGTFDVPLSSKP